MSPSTVFGVVSIVGCLSLGMAAPPQDAGKVAPAPKTTPAAPAKAAAADPATAKPDAKPAASEMQTYYVAILRHGPKWVADGQPGAMVLTKQHHAYVAQLANLGVIVLAGACGEQAEATDPTVALCVLAVPSLEKATNIIDQDPAVLAGHLRAEVISWVAPKGLGLQPSPATAAGEGAPAPVEGTKPGAVAPGRKTAPAGGAPAGDTTAPKPPAPAPKAAPPAGTPSGAGAAAPKSAQKNAQKAVQPKG